MKAKLEFSLPEEEGEFRDAINGYNWKNVVRDFYIELRGKLKHGHEFKNADEALEWAKKQILDYAQDCHLDIYNG